MNVSEQFERHFNPKRFKDNGSRTTAYGRAPRKTKDQAELIKIEQQYIRQGFDAREARFKARTYHTMKL